MSDRPPPSEQESKLIGYCLEALQEGESYLRAQTHYNKIPETIKAIMSDYSDERLRSSLLSGTTDNRLGKICQDLSAGLTDIKPFWEYKTNHKKYEQQGTNFGKLSLHWWLQRFIDMRFNDTVKYALAAGTGYSHVFYNTELNDIDMLAEDPRDVLPIRPSDNISIQNAMGVIVRREKTVNQLKRIFPHKESRIKADRDGSLAQLEQHNTQMRIASQLGNTSPFWSNLIGGRAASQLPRIPTADFFTCYIKDDSRNESSEPIIMGDPDQNWSYEVKPNGLKYPRGRRIRFTRSAILDDGPNIYWHGLFPLCKLTLDSFPWTWLGKAPLWDLLPLQRALDRNLRVIDDHNERVARPGLIVDKNATSRAALDKIDTRKSGLKMQHNPIAGKGAQVVFEPPLDATIKEYVQFLIDEMNVLSGVMEAQNLMKLGQIPSSETIEKMIESMSPSIRLRSRVIEAFMREFAMMVAFNFLQFYSLPMRLHVLGPNALTYEDFDFEPGTLIPDFLEEDYGSLGELKPERVLSGPRPKYDRARDLMLNFTFHIAPGSLLAASEVTRKLIYLQLARAGWVDIFTLLEVLGIPNVGEPPNGATTIMERLQAQQALGLGMEVSAAGRKASGQEMPHIKIAES